MLASCTTSLSLCKSFSKNSFFLLSTTYNYLSICFRCRSFLKADAKVQFFLIPCKTFAKKNAIFIQILTLVYILRYLLWAHTLFLLRASVRDDKTYGTYWTYGTYRTYGTNKAGQPTSWLADQPVYRMANHPTGCLPTTPSLPITPIFHNR